MTGRPLLAVTLAVLVGCGGDRTPGDESGSEDHPLAGITLRGQDVPGALEPNPDETGPAPEIRALLPPRRVFPNLPPIPSGLAGGFRDGYESGFAHPSQLGPAPSPPPEGQITLATSSVARFEDQGSAADFFGYLSSLHLGSEAPLPRDEVSAPGLGDEGYGWHKGVDIAGAEVRGTETWGYVWRRGDQVLTVTLGGAPGAATQQEARALADTVDARAA